MLDWDDLRFFLAVARHRTMSAAARSLGVAQPTVSRRIDAFEKKLGARLFLRSSAAAWDLSPAGRSVLAHAEGMEAQALAAEAAAAGRDAGVDGEVRVTASEWMIASVLGPRLGPFLVRYPSLSIQLVADARHYNLVRREADLAVRPSKFQQLEIFQRQIAVLEFGLYASDEYLARQGVPEFGAAAQGHRLIGMTEQIGNIADLEWLPPLIGSARVVVRTNGRGAMATMAAAGIGIACLPRFVGDAHPALRLLATPRSRPRRQLWLGVHRSARAVPRVKAVGDFITETFGRIGAALAPDN